MAYTTYVVKYILWISLEFSQALEQQAEPEGEGTV
jgi:hypothetical protein